MTSKEDPAAVCPESTVESASMRNSVPKSASNQVQGKLVCESTIESANRRNFIRKAALATAAVGVGSALFLPKNVVPSSSAVSNVASSYKANCVVVDACNLNKGSYGGCLGIYGSQHALSFGFSNSCGIVSGSAIGSAQNCLSNPNYFGLDFYTCYSKRVSITHCGNVGIGVCPPSVRFQVDSSGYLVGKFKNNNSGTCKTALVQVETGDSTPLEWNIGVSGAGNGLGIADGSFYLERLTNGTSNGAKLTINGCGKVGIGTDIPSSTLCVVGSTNTAISGYSACGNGVYGQSCSSLCCAAAVEGVMNSSCAGAGSAGVRGINKETGAFGIGVYGSQAGSGWGVYGYTPHGTGVFGCSPGGTGVCGFSAAASAYGVLGRNSASGGIGVEGRACNAGAIPMIAKGASGQSANLQQWEASCGTVYAVINKAGSLGLGGVTKPHHVLCISGIAHASKGFSIGPCVCVNTTLAVNGSMAAKTRTVGSTTTLLTTDYAILATGTITLTLPPAKTQNGMMIFIKNTSTSTVSVVPGGTDSIEGATSASPKTLTKQYDSLTLISNGSNEWFIQSGVKCGAVIS